MSRLLALQALKDLPSDLKKVIIAKAFPTLAQIIRRLRTQHPSSSSFRHLDIAIVGFVHGSEQKVALARLSRSERNWVIGRCRLFGLEYQAVRTIGGKGLILLKRDKWVYNSDIEVCKLIWCKTRWRYRCESCDLATNLDLKELFVQPFLCPMCIQIFGDKGDKIIPCGSREHRIFHDPFSFVDDEGYSEEESSDEEQPWVDEESEEEYWDRTSTDDEDSEDGSIDDNEYQFGREDEDTDSEWETADEEEAMAM